MSRPMTRFLALIAAALALIAAPAAAEKIKPDIAEYRAIELKNVLSGKTPIDPDKAYIFVRSPEARSFGVFLKTPNAEEIASYEAKWREEFAEAQADYPKEVKRYKAAVAAGREPSKKPVEPTEETFAIAPIDNRMIVGFGPQFVFDKTDGDPKSFSYLIEVEPGEYTYLGPILYLPGAATGGVCFCMGSVRFEAKAGQITSLGDFLSMGWADRAALELSTTERELLPDRPAVPTDWGVPASLAQYTSAKAELRAAGKRNNFLNALVGRIPPVPGVLAYERDVPIDLIGLAEAKAKAEAEAAARAEAEAAAAAEARAAAAAAGPAPVETPATPAPAQ